MCFPRPFLGSRNAHKSPPPLDFCKTCPSNPRKRTLAKAVVMSAKCQNRPPASQQLNVRVSAHALLSRNQSPIIALGKDGKAYLLDRNNLGGTHSSVGR